jgi:UDP-N-acetylglucosamine 2-epimerase (non-hydrolysing)
MKEVLDFYQPKFLKSDILQKLKFHPKGYFVVSVHREENVDNPIHLENILEALRALYNRYHLPMLVSTHPRTRKRLEALNPNYEADYPFLIFSKPLGFIDYIALQMQSFCVISDSGTISEESAILKFPAISIRKSMERPEAQDSGVISLSGLEANTIVKSVEIAIEHINANVGWEVPEDYSILNTSWRVLKLMIGNARLSNEWWGVK